MRTRLLLCALLAGASVSCIVEAPSSERSRGKSAQAVRKASPPLQVTSGAVLGDKVKLVAARFDPGAVAAGEAVRVSLQFEALDTLDKDYLVFVHVEDPRNAGERVNADHPPAGGRHPTSQWKKGEVVRDDFNLFLPPNTKARAVNVWVGLWEPGTDARLPLKNPDVVRNDGNDRVLLGSITVLKP